MGYERIKFNSVYLGDHAWAVINYEGNVTTRIVPRASGVKLRDTNENGGGVYKITIRAWIIKSTRKAVEQYLYNLRSSIGADTKHTIDIEGWSLTNCAVEGFTMENMENTNNTNLTLSLVKSV